MLLQSALLGIAGSGALVLRAGGVEVASTEVTVLSVF